MREVEEVADPVLLLQEDKEDIVLTECVPTPAAAADAQTAAAAANNVKRAVTFSSRVRWKTSQTSLRNDDDAMPAPCL